MNQRWLGLVECIAVQKKKKKALDRPARTQSDVFLVFSRTGNPLVKTVFLRGQRKLKKNSSTDFTLLATIVTIVAEQPNFDAQEAQYTTKTTTPVATAAESDEENKQNSEFIFQRSLRQRRDALKSLQSFAQACSGRHDELHTSATSVTGKVGHTK